MSRPVINSVAAALSTAAIAAGAVLAGAGSASAAEPLSAGASAASLTPSDDRHRHRHCDSEEIRRIKHIYVNDHEKRRAMLRERGCPEG